VSEYQAALQRAKERAAAGSMALRLEMRARRLLGAAGWSATPEQLRAAADLLPEPDRIEAELLEPSIARAVEMQSDPNIRGRRLRPEEVEVMPRRTEAESGRVLPTELREKIRDYVWNRRRNEPGVSAALVHTDVCEVFGVTLSYAGFYGTYWRKADGAAAGEPAKKKAKPSPRKQPAAVRSATVAPAVEAPPPAAAAEPAELPVLRQSEPVVVGGPVMQAFRLSDGRMRIQLDVEFDLTHALATLTAASARGTE
jgi:hypothetical protein